MIRKTWHLFQDLFAYATMGWNRTRMGTRRRGDDYTDDGYRQLATKTARRIHPGGMHLRLDRIIQETDSTRTFRFTRTDGDLPPFCAGQYLNVFVQAGGVLTSRPYSISSAPGEPFVDLTVRLKPGGFVSTHLFEKLEEGDELDSTGPSGWFCHEPLIDGDDLVFLAGGSGITPFMSILRDFANRGTGHRVHLLYGSRTQDDIVFAKALEDLGQKLPDLTVTHVLSEPPADYEGDSGFLDADRIRESVGDLDGRMFYVCGPNVMLDLCRSALDQLDVPLNRVRFELYGPPDDPTQVPGWPSGLAPETRFTVQVEDGKTLEAPAGEPLINSLERNGIVIPAVCRSGECSACRMKVLSGEVFMPPDMGVRESDLRHGYVHACIAYPVSNIHVRL